MKLLIRLEKIVDSGEGHINVLCFKPHSIGAGTWSPALSGLQLLNFIYRNGATAANGDNITFKVYLARGTYTMNVVHWTVSNGGIADFSIGGTVVDSIDMYSAGTVYNVNTTTTGIVIPTSGLKDLLVQLNGKNGASSAYEAGLTDITLFRTA